jgi:hypothetical protein
MPEHPGVRQALVIRQSGAASRTFTAPALFGIAQWVRKKVVAQRI